MAPLGGQCGPRQMRPRPCCQTVSSLGPYRCSSKLNVQAVQQRPAAAVCRTVCLYQAKQQEHRRESLERRSALALGCAERPAPVDLINNLAGVRPCSPAVPRLRVAVDVDEGEQAMRQTHS
jgi:hypothetical protein